MHLTVLVGREDMIVAVERQCEAQIFAFRLQPTIRGVISNAVSTNGSGGPVTSNSVPVKCSRGSAGGT